jgi:hypothetical protein
MSVASPVIAFRPIGVLLGGPFAPQRSINPKPVVCALLRSRERLAGAARQITFTGSAPAAAHEEIGHYG